MKRLLRKYSSSVSFCIVIFYLSVTSIVFFHYHQINYSTIPVLNSFPVSETNGNNLVPEIDCKYSQLNNTTKFAILTELPGYNFYIEKEIKIPSSPEENSSFLFFQSNNFLRAPPTSSD